MILWADRKTRVDGGIAVTGTQGGFAETSALGVLAIGDAASVEVGAGGRWLIDPVDITIDAAQAAAIVGTLNGGGDVTVTTSPPAGQPGNLVVDSDIVWNGAGGLTLFADDTLTVSNSRAITTSGGGDLTATAGVDTSIGGPVTSSGGGSIGFQTGRNLVVNGNVTATGTGAISLRAGTGDITVSNAGNDRNIQISTDSGALSMAATRGSVILRRLPAANTRNVRVLSSSGPVDLTAGTGILVLGNRARPGRGSARPRAAATSRSPRPTSRWSAARGRGRRRGCRRSAPTTARASNSARTSRAAGRICASRARPT